MEWNGAATCARSHSSRMTRPFHHEIPAPPTSRPLLSVSGLRPEGGVAAAAGTGIDPKDFPISSLPFGGDGALSRRLLGSLSSKAW
jgi:hypothetical protein